MRTSRVGDLTVSVIGLGCNNFGRALDAGESAAVVAAALDAGVTYFDTASSYGEGRSEEFLGAALGSERDRVVISTKVGLEIPGWEGSGGAGFDYVKQVLDRSLRNLGRDHVDIYMVHFPDPATPIEETLGAMNDLVVAGKVRQAGCSNFDKAQLTEALQAADQRGFAPFVCDQVHFSLLHREPESNRLDALCAEHGVAMLPYYPLANGLLTGKTRRGREPQGRLRLERYQKFLTDENFDVVEALQSFGEARGLTLVQVALGWLLTRDAVPSVTPGATTPDQVTANVRAAEWIPTESDLAEIAVILSSGRVP